jgi:SAM-dependent methyltransferase
MIRDSLVRVSRKAWLASLGNLPSRDSLVRYSMYRSIEAATRGFRYDGEVLSISHSQKLCRLIGATPDQIVEGNYPEHAIPKLNFESDRFAALASDQVLEHVECDPQSAIDECWRVLKPGGVMVHTTCFMTPFHGSAQYGVPGEADLWRYTHQGLHYLCRRFTEVIEAGGWGNPLMPVMTGLGLSSMPVPDATWHPLHKLARLNRLSYAYVVWVVARK